MYQGLNEGMYVYTADGHRLGRVVACEADGFRIEKGFFFPQEYFCSYDRIRGIEGDHAVLSLTRDMLGQGDAAGAGYAAERSIGVSGQREELRVPVAEERLETEKHVREVGEVRLHKEIVTEQRTVTVPVMREVVRVERVPVNEARPATSGEATFQGGTVTVPLREEEIEIRKRPVVREEIRVTKTPIREEKRVSAQVRREEVDVDDAAIRSSSPWSDRPGLRADSSDDLPLRTGLDDDDDFNR